MYWNQMKKDFNETLKSSAVLAPEAGLEPATL